MAKVLGALLPTLVISLAGLALYFGGIVAFGRAGRRGGDAEPCARCCSSRCVGPAAALVSLQAAIVISSRVNDARTAQQFGVLIIIPLAAVLVAQFTGALWLSATAVAAIGARSDVASGSC